MEPAAKRNLEETLQALYDSEINVTHRALGWRLGLRAVFVHGRALQ
jgi:hypothetical protein